MIVCSLWELHCETQVLTFLTINNCDRHNVIITANQINEYTRNGVVLLPGIFADWVDVIRKGIEHNLREPGQYAAENLHKHETGRFFDDYCNWQRIPQFADFIENSTVLEAGARLMKSKTVQVFHEHVLIKEPGTSKPTPWHQDAPYYFVEGNQTVSFWIPVDPVKDASLRLVAKSHLWNKPVLPQRWLGEENFYADSDKYMPIPDPDSDPAKYEILEWEMNPGDAVAFHYKTLHGARGNLSNARRRAFSLRLVGDDARYTRRAGRTSPPFPGHDMVEGQRLREDWFPIFER